MKKFAYVWEYIVREDRVDQFVRAYGPDGDWVKLFSLDEAYLGTKLYHDLDNPNRFLTTDYWTSKTERDLFREKYAPEFEEIDRACELLTKSEKFLGDFEIIE